MSSKLLTTERIVDSVRSVGIPKKELVVVGGAALQLFGIKRTKDIDAVIPTTRLMRRIDERARDVQHGRRSRHSPIDDETVTAQGITFSILDWIDFYDSESTGTLALLPAPNDQLYHASFEELHDEAIEIEGILVSPPERILEWKQAIGRPKDQTDIEKIQAHLANAS